MKRVIIASDNLAERIEDELYVLMDSNDGKSEVRGIATRNYYTLEQRNGHYVIVHHDDAGTREVFDYLSQVANWLIKH